MKKYMIPQLILVFFFIGNANAMEVVLQPCYLAQMPCDILDNIVSFLMETDEEFIARTRVKKEITEECRIFFNDLDMKCQRWSFCPDKTKLVAAVHHPYEIPDYATPLYYLMIIDLHKNNDIKIKYKEQLFYHPVNGYYSVNHYDRVALSPGGSMIAMFHAERECRNGEMHCEYIFHIRRVNEEKERKIDFPYSFYPEIIAFNKQGTLLVAHGQDKSTQKDVHQIFSLKTVDSNTPYKVDCSNKSQNYLKDKFVCNKLCRSL